MLNFTQSEFLKIEIQHAEILIIYINLNYFSAEKLFLDDPELQDDIPTSYLSHKELYEYSVAKACKVFMKIRALQDEGKGGVDNFM